MQEYRILFLEDEEMIREVLAEYLKIAGYQVTQVGDGQKALETLQQETFDFAILDIMVPGITGLEVLEYISIHHPELPVVMLTALGDEQTQVEAFNRYADDYIIKPVSPIILLKRVETILRRGHHFVSSQETAGESQQKGLQIDELAFRAQYNDRDLELTLSEFLILQVLLKHPKQVFSRDQLIDHVFGTDYICSDRVIDTHIKNLRKKLPINCIQTVIGVGYRYEVVN